jgi:hypothetical protein
MLMQARQEVGGEISEKLREVIRKEAATWRRKEKWRGMDTKGKENPKSRVEILKKKGGETTAS